LPQITKTSGSASASAVVTSMDGGERGKRGNRKVKKWGGKERGGEGKCGEGRE